MPAHAAPRYTIALVTWRNSEIELRSIRTQVFMHEQGVPAELEWDGEDAHAIHVLATDLRGNPIGTGRMLVHGEQAHIGRMAVLPSWRNQGVGASLLSGLLEAASARGIHSLFLNAQTTAVAFYQRFNFVREGAEFLDAGIPHYRMSLTPQKP